jgi:hypothetical protein
LTGTLLLTMSRHTYATSPERRLVAAFVNIRRFKTSIALPMTSSIFVVAAARASCHETCLTAVPVRTPDARLFVTRESTPFPGNDGLENFGTASVTLCLITRQQLRRFTV